jgi:hypothetical protein
MTYFESRIGEVIWAKSWGKSPINLLAASFGSMDNCSAHLRAEGRRSAM